MANKETKEVLEAQDVIELKSPKQIEDAEWCFQFFNNEPVVFAWQEDGVEPSPLVMQLNPTESEGLNFSQNGMNFRIFPRAISEETKKKRSEGLLNQKDASKD
jgi:hypothetical protein